MHANSARLRVILANERVLRLVARLFIICHSHPVRSGQTDTNERIRSSVVLLMEYYFKTFWILICNLFAAEIQEIRSILTVYSYSG